MKCTQYDLMLKARTERSWMAADCSWKTPC